MNIYTLYENINALKNINILFSYTNEIHLQFFVIYSISSSDTGTSMRLFAVSFLICNSVNVQYF